MDQEPHPLFFFIWLAVRNNGRIEADLCPRLFYKYSQIISTGKEKQCTGPEISEEFPLTLLKHDNSKWHNLYLTYIMWTAWCVQYECTRLQIFAYCSSAHLRTQLKWLSVFKWQILTLILWTRQGSKPETLTARRSVVATQNMGTHCTISITVWLKGYLKAHSGFWKQLPLLEVKTYLHSHLKMKMFKNI